MLGFDPPNLTPRTRYVFTRTTLKLGLFVLLDTAQWLWALRSDPALAAASFLAEVANLSPKLSQAEWDAQVQRLGQEFGVDPVAHRSAINRVRKRS